MAFGHQSVTKLSAYNRAVMIYSLANECPSEWAAREAVDFADSIVLKIPSLKNKYITKWKAAADASWMPASNSKPVSTIVKIIRKGSKHVPTSIRYIGQQFNRACACEGEALSPADDLLRDIVVAYSLQVFVDPRPIDPVSRINSLLATPKALYSRFIAPKKSPEFYHVLRTFLVGVSEGCPEMRYAMHRWSVGITVSLPVYSYTAITRRVLSPGLKTPAAIHGIPACELSPVAYKTLTEVSVNGTSKRMKAAIKKLPAKDTQVLRKHVTTKAVVIPRYLNDVEIATQDKFPSSYVYFCNDCLQWCAYVHGKKRQKNGYLTVNLNDARLVACSACGGVNLKRIRLNGLIIGCLRLCSGCGEELSGTPHLRGACVICKKCALVPEPPSICNVCSSVASGCVIVTSNGAYQKMALCKTHTPESGTFSPDSPAEDVLYHIGL